MKPNDLVSYIDHTLLKPQATSQDVITLCEEAKAHKFVAVCVNPCHVALARNTLGSREVRVATVIGFPLGASSTSTKATEAQEAILDGADELDMVINVGWLIEGLEEFVLGDIRAVVEAAGDVPVKVIIETALLTDQQKITACKLAQAAGAAYVKTSTGFASGGATVADIRLMREAVGPSLGVKASGGIRSLASAVEMIGAGATRLGTSSSVSILLESQEQCHS